MTKLATVPAKNTVVSRLGRGIQFLLIGMLSLSLAACATMQSPRVSSELAYGKRLFEEGYYKRAMHDLLPLACDGQPEAQYAVGYMYYYGYGVAQDTDVGYFWIKRSADHGYAPAHQALVMIEQKQATVPVKKI